MTRTRYRLTRHKGYATFSTSDCDPDHNVQLVTEGAILQLSQVCFTRSSLGNCPRWTLPQTSRLLVHASLTLTVAGENSFVPTFGVVETDINSSTQDPNRLSHYTTLRRLQYSTAPVQTITAPFRTVLPAVPTKNIAASKNAAAVGFTSGPALLAAGRGRATQLSRERWGHLCECRMFTDHTATAPDIFAFLSTKTRTVKTTNGSGFPAARQDRSCSYTDSDPTSATESCRHGVQVAAECTSYTLHTPA